MFSIIKSLTLYDFGLYFLLYAFWLNSVIRRYLSASVNYIYWPHRYGIYPVPIGRFQDGTVLGRELILKSRPGINSVLNGFL